MALNVIYFGFQFWGIYEWRKTLLNKTDAGVDVSVKRLSLLQFLQMTFVVLAGTFAVSLFLRHIGDSSPVLDAFTMVASLIAMGLMVKQYSEQWLLWILVDIASIYMWVIPALDQPGSWSMVAMWTVITGNALYGAYMWFVVKINK
jgi:nicotinamide mononucleotide transporter